MLGKLLKYDLKYMLKNMSAFYILTIFFAFFTRVILSLNQTLFVNIIGKISISVLITMVFNIIFNTILRSWIRFNDSIYKDEAYLTHTLPVTKTEIYESRFLHSLLFSIFGFVIICIGLFIAFYTKDVWSLMTNYLNKVFSGINLNTFLAIIFIIVIFFLEIFNIIQSGFLGLIIGNRSNNNKVAFSFLYGFITYMISQGFVIAIIFIIGLFNDNIMGIFTSSTILGFNTIKLLLVLLIIIYSFIIFLMNLLCVKELKRGVNIY